MLGRYEIGESVRGALWIRPPHLIIPSLSRNRQSCITSSSSSRFLFFEALVRLDSYCFLTIPYPCCPGIVNFSGCEGTSLLAS